MPYIKGTLGGKVIAQENIDEKSMRKQRRMDDPLRCIRIDCKIPQNINYKVGTMDIFDFGGELQKVQTIKYEEVLKLEGEFNDAFANFKYWSLPSNPSIYTPNLLLTYLNNDISTKSKSILIIFSYPH